MSEKPRTRRTDAHEPFLDWGQFFGALCGLSRRKSARWNTASLLVQTPTFALVATLLFFVLISLAFEPMGLDRWDWDLVNIGTGAALTGVALGVCSALAPFIRARRLRISAEVCVWLFRAATSYVQLWMVMNFVFLIQMGTS